MDLFFRDSRGTCVPSAVQPKEINASSTEVTNGRGRDRDSRRTRQPRDPASEVRARAVAERSGDRSLEGTVSARLRSLIVESGGVKPFARLLGVEDKTVRNWRDGRSTKGSTKRKPELPTLRSLATIAATFRVSADWILGLARSPHHQIDVGVPGAVALVDYISLLYGLQPPTNLAERNPDYAEQQKQARRVFAESMAAAREELDIARVSKEAEQIPERRAALRARKRSP